MRRTVVCLIKNDFSYSSTGNTIRMANINSGLCNLCDIGRRFGVRNVGRFDPVARSNHPHGNVRQLFDVIIFQQMYRALVQEARAFVHLQKPQYQSYRGRK